MGVIVLLFALVVYLCYFTTSGYRMTAVIHGFEKLDDCVYVEKNWSGDKKEALQIVNEAKKRVKQYFGTVKSHPVILICDDEKKIKKLGGDHDTAILFLKHVYSYISVSSKYLNVDILAHEMTHAEAHTRADTGKIATASSMPVWFDEGLAMQNDYREMYNLENVPEDTKEEDMIFDYAAMSDPSVYYSENKDKCRLNYILSKHEVATWIEKHGMEELMDLLSKLQSGNSFDSCYKQN